MAWKWYAEKSPSEKQLLKTGALIGVFILAIPQMFSLFGVLILRPLVVWKWKADQLAKYQPKDAPKTYHFHKVCPDAWHESFNHGESHTLDHFEVPLHEGCYGGMVHIPYWWKTWSIQGNGNDYWAFVWVSGEEQERGTLTLNTDFNVSFYVPAFRLQGRGKALIFTNDPPPKGDGDK